MKPAIVLGMGMNGLGVSRSLGRQGIEVYGIEYRKVEAIQYRLRRTI